ncbi:MAG: CarD family transcriptional regulator [Firmicutes bacterium]|jgi:CarD family transcriptional regulator|nr:CarD family transcriptional regulator [Bacillota bacterium]
MFNVGDKVAYPMHGAGIIERIEDKEILGEVRKYFILKLPLKKMDVMIPVENAEKLGLRYIVDMDTVNKVMEIFSQEISDMSENWNRRYRNNLEKIKSGDILEVAMVVKDLIIMDITKGLSTGEKKMLVNTKQILVSEVVLVLDSTEEEIEKRIKDSLKIDK